jgi:hypothetical protein
MIRFNRFLLTGVLLSGMMISVNAQTSEVGAKEKIPMKNKEAANLKTFQMQTTCPVQGDTINKKLYVDYKDKRIYVCCKGCIDEVKNNPEKYITKLKGLGQDVEIISGKKTTSKAEKADTSAKAKEMMNMKNKEMGHADHTGHGVLPKDTSKVKEMKQEKSQK